jgi:hypothetical protein
MSKQNENLEKYGKRKQKFLNKSKQAEKEK